MPNPSAFADAKIVVDLRRTLLLLDLATAENCRGLPGSLGVRFTAELAMAEAVRLMERRNILYSSCARGWYG